MDIIERLAFLLDYVEDKKCTIACEYCDYISIVDSCDGYYGQGDYSKELICKKLGSRLVHEGTSCYFKKAKRILSLLSKEEEEIRAENAFLRYLLWATHPCVGKYGDDGELQCNRFIPPIDFKRDAPVEIENKIILHNEERQALKESKGVK